VLNASDGLRRFKIWIDRYIDRNTVRLGKNPTVKEKTTRINPAIKIHYELQIIKTLVQNAPRDADKLERLLKTKQRQKEEAIVMRDTQMLVTEIEMLRVVLCLVRRDVARA
jgi:hypothetical protein